MKMRKFAAVAALVTAAMGVTAGTVNAAPAADTVAPIDYAATTTATDMTIKTDAGSMVVEDGQFKIKAADGTTVAGTALNFRMDDFEFPIAANINGNVATLTPQLDVAQAVYKPVALPFENVAPWKSDYDREQAAWNRLKDTIATGATIGTLVGGISGAALGCVVGGAVLATAAGVLTAMFGALGGAALGCILGMSVVGFLGTLVGQLLVTAPVAILAAVQYFSTINEPSINPAPAK